MRTQTRSTRFDVHPLRVRETATWAPRRPARGGLSLPLAAEALCEAADVRSSDHVLDVATAAGDAALAAARRFADVTAAAAGLEALEHTGRRAESEGLFVLTRLAEPDSLPFTAASFDVALSTFGVALAAQPSRAAAELVRVVRPGGRIGLAAWTPDGFTGELQRLLDGVHPRLPGLADPGAWGTRDGLVGLFGEHARSMRIERRTAVHRHRSAEHWIAHRRRECGQLRAAFASSSRHRRQALRAALVELLSKWDRGGGPGLAVPADYLQIVMRRR